MPTSKSQYRIYLGHSPDEIIPYNVATFTLRATARLRDGEQLWTSPISRHTLYQAYRRPTEERRNTVGDRQLYDVISEAPMSTEHAIARFFIPYLQDYQGWALFADSDVLFRRSITELFDQADPAYAVMCVQHPPQLIEGVKKEGQIQQAYPRKNWSSVMLINCAHDANACLTPTVLNSWPGRDLHGFTWLLDEQIGTLDPTWNYLVNVSEPLADPAIVHFTEGVPSLPAHWDDPYGEDWRAVARGLSAGISSYRAAIAGTGV